MWTTPVDNVTFGVRRPPVLVVLGAAVLAALWCVLAGAPEDRLVAGVVAVALLAVAFAGWRLRVRLTADRAGFVVHRLGGRQGYSWSDVARLSTPSRRRRGLTTTTLEFDLVDDTLIVFGRLDLGADPVAVRESLTALRFSS